MYVLFSFSDFYDYVINLFDILLDSLSGAFDLIFTLFQTIPFVCVSLFNTFPTVFKYGIGGLFSIIIVVLMFKLISLVKS